MQPGRGMLTPRCSCEQLMHDRPASMRLRVKRYKKRRPAMKRRENLRYFRPFQKNNRRKGQRWTEKELRLVLAMGTRDRVLSRRPERSVQAIQMQRIGMLSFPLWGGT